jgi:hypothetical protein
MYCYECSQDGSREEAIGLCHHCSVALCPHHWVSREPEAGTDHLHG